MQKRSDFVQKKIFLAQLWRAQSENMMAELWRWRQLPASLLLLLLLLLPSLPRHSVEGRTVFDGGGGGGGGGGAAGIRRRPAGAIGDFTSLRGRIDRVEKNHHC